MPPFRLEILETTPTHKFRKKLYYTKGSYIPAVKNTNWQVELESQPKDNAPYCPGSLNLFTSHYNRLGVDDQPFDTTTHIMLRQVLTKDEGVVKNPENRLINYYTYKK